MICMNCGSQMPDGGNFCSVCGSSALSGQNMCSEFCPNCGKPIADGSSFCGECGSPIGYGAVGSINTPMGNGNWMGQQAYAPNVNTTPRHSKAVSKNRTKRNILIVGIVVLLIAVIAVGYLNFGENLKLPIGKKSEKKLVKTITYSSDGNISSWDKYEYDSKGNNTKITTYYNDDTQGGWTKNEFDSDNNLIKAVTYEQNGEISQEIEYDGNLINKVYYDSGKKWYEMVYDLDDILFKYIPKYYYDYDEDGTITDYETTEEYEYDNNGNPTKCTVTSNEGIENYYITYEYNRKNELIRFTICDEDDTISNEIEYYSNGESKLTSYNEDGTVDHEFEWNSDENMKKFSGYLDNELYFCQEIEFDLDNNPIKQSQTYVDDRYNRNAWTEYIYE